MFVKGAPVDVTDVIQDLYSYDHPNGDKATQNITSTKWHESHKHRQKQVLLTKNTVKPFSHFIWCTYKEGWDPLAFFQQIQHGSGWYT